MWVCARARKRNREGELVKKPSQKTLRVNHHGCDRFQSMARSSQTRTRGQLGARERIRVRRQRPARRRVRVVWSELRLSEPRERRVVDEPARHGLGRREHEVDLAIGELRRGRRRGDGEREESERETEQKRDENHSRRGRQIAPYLGLLNKDDWRFRENRRAHGRHNDNEENTERSEQKIALSLFHFAPRLPRVGLESNPHGRQFHLCGGLDEGTRHCPRRVRAQTMMRDADKNASSLPGRRRSGRPGVIALSLSHHSLPSLSPVQSISARCSQCPRLYSRTLNQLARDGAHAQAKA